MLAFNDAVIYFSSSESHKEHWHNDEAAKEKMHIFYDFKHHTFLLNNDHACRKYLVNTLSFQCNLN